MAQPTVAPRGLVRARPGAQARARGAPHPSRPCSPTPLRRSPCAGEPSAPPVTAREEAPVLEREVPATLSAVEAAPAASPSAPQPPVQADPSRCMSCSKKIGLTAFKCRCGYSYCNSHRYSDQHDCPFDYKKMGREQVAKANPLVQAQKIEKI